MNVYVIMKKDKLVMSKDVFASIQVCEFTVFIYVNVCMYACI